MAVGNSIVDYLKSQGQDSSYAARKKLAEQQGISNYTGTAGQNSALLRTLQSSANNSASSNSPVAGKGFPAASYPGENAGNNVSENKAFEMVSSPVVTAGSSSSKKTSSSPVVTAGYTPGSQVNAYLSKVQDYEGDEPDGFESRYSTQIDSILNSILNREAFSYDMNEDMLYQQYKDAYMRQGQQAMRDTMGNASAMTGGYGSTYAQTVGSQAYDQYLAGLNDKVPELYDLAYQKYLNEGNEMYNQLGVLQDLDTTDYARYRDTVSDYYTNRDYYNNRYNQEYGYDYGQYQDELAQENWEEQFEYQKEQDALAQENWQAQFDYQKEQDALAMALAQQKAASGGSSRSSSSGNAKKSSKSKNTDGYAPIAANVVEQAEANGWSNLEAYEYVMQLGEEGRITADQVDDILKAAGIDEEEALEEKNNAISSIGLGNLLLNHYSTLRK